MAVKANKETTSFKLLEEDSLEDKPSPTMKKIVGEIFEKEVKDQDVANSFRNLMEYREAPQSPSASSVATSISTLEPDGLHSPTTPSSPVPIPADERLPNELLDEICQDIGMKEGIGLDFVEYLMEQDMDPQAYMTPEAIMNSSAFSSSSQTTILPAKTPGPSSTASSASDSSWQGSSSSAGGSGMGIPPASLASTSGGSNGAPPAKRPHLLPSSSSSSSTSESGYVAAASSSTSAASNRPLTPHSPKVGGQQQVFKMPQTPPTPRKPVPGPVCTSTPSSSIGTCPGGKMMEGKSSNGARVKTSSPGPLSSCSLAQQSAICPKPGESNFLGPPATTGSCAQSGQQCAGPSMAPSPQNHNFQRLGRPSPPVVNVKTMQQQQMQHQMQQMQQQQHQQQHQHQQHQRWLAQQQQLQQQQHQQQQHQMPGSSSCAFTGSVGPPGMGQHPMFSPHHQQGNIRFSTSMDSLLDQGYNSAETSSIRSLASSSSMTMASMHPQQQSQQHHPQQTQMHPQQQSQPHPQQHPQQQQLQSKPDMSMMGHTQQHPHQQQQPGHSKGDMSMMGPHAMSQSQQQRPPMGPMQKSVHFADFPTSLSPDCSGFNSSFTQSDCSYDMDGDFREGVQRQAKILPRHMHSMKPEVAPYSRPNSNGNFDFSSRSSCSQQASSGMGSPGTGMGAGHMGMGGGMMGMSSQTMGMPGAMTSQQFDFGKPSTADSSMYFMDGNQNMMKMDSGDFSQINFGPQQQRPQPHPQHQSGYMAGGGPGGSGDMSGYQSDMSVQDGSFGGQDSYRQAMMQQQTQQQGAPGFGVSCTVSSTGPSMGPMFHQQQQQQQQPQGPGMPGYMTPNASPNRMGPVMHAQNTPGTPGTSCGQAGYNQGGFPMGNRMNPAMYAQQQGGMAGGPGAPMWTSTPQSSTMQDLQQQQAKAMGPGMVPCGPGMMTSGQPGPMPGPGMPQASPHPHLGACTGPNCNACKHQGTAPNKGQAVSMQAFIHHLVSDKSNAFRSHPLFPLLRDLIIADMNFCTPSFPYQLISNLPTDFDRLLQNFLQRNPPQGNYQNNYAVESVVMDALRYAHTCLIDKIRVRQEQDKATKSTSKSLQCIERFCEEFNETFNTSLPGNAGMVASGGGPSGAMGGIHSLKDNKFAMMDPLALGHSQFVPPGMGKGVAMSALGGGSSQFRSIKDAQDYLSDTGSAMSSISNISTASGQSGKTESKKHPSLPKEAVALMLDWLRLHKDNPYPNDDEKAMLIKETGLTINQINYWFTNARRRILPKWGAQNQCK